MWIPIIVCIAAVCGVNEWRGGAQPTESDCKWMAEQIIQFVATPQLQLQFRCEKQR